MGRLAQSLAGLATFFIGLFTASKAAAETTPALPEPSTSNDVDGYNGVRAMARKLAGILGLASDDARLLEYMFLVQSYSESRGNRSAANRTDSESKAARTLYFARGNDDKLRKAVGSFPDKEWYFPGSGGWFGLMPVVLLNVVGGRSAKGIGLGPRSNYDAWASTVTYAAYLSRLVRRSEWGASSQDLYALKAGGAAGSLMDDPGHPRYEKAASNLDKAVAALGLPGDVGEMSVPASRIFSGRDWLEIYKEGR